MIFLSRQLNTRLIAYLPITFEYVWVSIYAEKITYIGNVECILHIKQICNTNEELSKKIVKN